MNKPTVFISYSHLDEEWKDRLVRHLAVSQKQGHLELWHDRMIGAGEDWERRIQAAMDAASVAILLVSANSLTSDFILREEVSRLLERRASEGLRIFPVVIKPCDWGAVDWLRRMNLRPKDGKPLSGGNEHEIDQALTQIAKEIRELLKRTAPPATPTFVPLNPDEISTSRLPRLLTPYLFGRDDELHLLDKAWADPHTNIVTFVAWGGVGKSALVSHWLQALEKDQWRGAERVFAWSFYSQGTSDHAATAEYFINAALRWFGGDALADKLQTAGQWEKGERLAQLIRQTRTLLILDGLEPVQHPPMAALQADVPEGGLKEQTMQALLRELASHQSGLCVVTTRASIADLTQFEGRSVVRHPLDDLSPAAGAQLLRRLKGNGSPEELEAAVSEYGGHSLALTLLGSYLGDVYAGDVRRRHEIESLEEDRKHGRHARKVLRAYEKWLGERGQTALLDVLRMLGLFDRPAEGASIAALRAAPAIAGLTDSLFRYERRKRWFGLSSTVTAEPISEREWQQTIAALRDLRLLAEASPHDPDTLDAHPLVREHFGQQLRRDLPEAWRAAHNRLYKYLTRTTPRFPDTLAGLTPLFAAVTHGCAAGRAVEAFWLVYRRRIRRFREGFLIHKLGAYSADLAVLQNFFATPWREPLADLPAAAQGKALNTAGFDLRALGRLPESVQPLQAALELAISKKFWGRASDVAGNLGEVYLDLGELPQARFAAQQSVELADRGGALYRRIWRGHLYRRIWGRTGLANALHQSGYLTEAKDTFREAEALQKEDDPVYPLLYAQAGFWYCDLLLGQGQLQEVCARAARMLTLAERDHRLHDIALGNLALARAHLSSTDADAHATAAPFLHRAVDGLRQAGTQYELPRGLLARVALYRLTGDHPLAQRDLDEALRIATRGSMRLHEADCHLESARLALATGDRASARKAWETAKAMIEEMGYHRRDGEVAEIEAQLNAAGE